MIGNKVFALYKGDKFIDVGTADEIAKKLNVTRQTILFYGTQAYRNRLAKRKKNLENHKILIEIDECEEDA